MSPIFTTASLGLRWIPTGQPGHSSQSEGKQRKILSLPSRRSWCHYRKLGGTSSFASVNTPELGSGKVSLCEETAHFSQVSSLRCGGSVCLLGQLTVFQDKFLIITQSHYCAISTANGECRVSFPLPPSLFASLCSVSSLCARFFPDRSLPASQLAVGEEGLGWLCQRLDLDPQASQISKLHMGLGRGQRTKA